MRSSQSVDGAGNAYFSLYFGGVKWYTLRKAGESARQACWTSGAATMIGAALHVEVPAAYLVDPANAKERQPRRVLRCRGQR